MLAPGRHSHSSVAHGAAQGMSYVTPMLWVGGTVAIMIAVPILLEMERDASVKLQNAELQLGAEVGAPCPPAAARG